MAAETRTTDAATQNNNSDYLPVLKLRSPGIKAASGLIPGESCRGESVSLLFQPPEAAASLICGPFLHYMASRSLIPSDLCSHHHVTVSHSDPPASLF